jgi:FkbM family methyltransferase
MHDRIVVRPVAVGEVAGHMPLILEGLEGAQAAFKEVDESACNDALTRVGERPLIDVPSVTLDEEFPVDLPIKLLKIDVEGHEGAILKGARRLLERRCINFILIELPKDAAGSLWGELMTQLNWLTEKNYVPCTLQLDGALTDHKSVAAALNRLERRNIVLMARDQYISIE